QGTPGAAFSTDLEMNRVEAIFRKGTDPEIDSYSGFFDNGHRKATALADYLHGRDITQVYLAGLAADYCVYFTAKDALKAGFKTFIIEDAIRAIDQEGYLKAKEDLKGLGAKFCLSQQLGVAD